MTIVFEPPDATGHERAQAVSTTKGNSFSAVRLPNGTTIINATSTDNQDVVVTVNPGSSFTPVAISVGEVIDTIVDIAKAIKDFVSDSGGSGGSGGGGGSGGDVTIIVNGGSGTINVNM